MHAIIKGKGVRIFMSFGQRLKRIRNFRGFTMKQLGMNLNIPERQADVRISQYESDKKMPRKDIIEQMARILDVNEWALDNPDINTYYGAMYNLFEYYFSYGLHPVKIDGKVYLTIDKNIAMDSLVESLYDWYNEYEAFQNGTITKSQFIDWMLKYPEYSKKNINKNPRKKWLEKK